MNAKARKKSPMSDEHKAALAKGRIQGNAVRKYLEALDANRPRRGRRRTTADINNRLAAIDAELATSSPVKRLQLIQERIDLTDELSAGDESVDLSGLEADFVDAASAYGESKGISYAAWRELGVPAAVLKAAGISRSTR